MRKLTIPVLVLAVAGFILAYGPAPDAGKSNLAGVWKTVEVSFTSPDTSWTNSATQPSLTIFTERHFANMRIAGDGPRERFSDDPTDAERLAAFDRFRANLGTYEVSGSTITRRIMIGRVPNAMDGEPATSTFEMEGNVLWRTFTTPTGNELLVKYTRVE